MKQTLGQRVKVLRTHYRLNQSEFAHLIDVSNMAISKIEIGHTEVPQHSTIDNIVSAFGTTHEWLEKGIGEMLPDGGVDITVPGNLKNQIENPWESKLYADLKESNSYLQSKLDQVTTMLSRLIENNSPLDKGKGSFLKVLSGTGLLESKSNKQLSARAA